MDNRNNEKLAEFKERYEKIPVPRSTFDEMQKGINAGKKERRKVQMKKMTRRTGMSVAAAIAVVGVMANISPVTANAMEHIPVIGAIARVVTFRTFEDTKDHYEAKIEIPQVSVENSPDIGINRSIEDYANQLIREYEKQVTEGLAGDGHYSVTSGYEVVTDNDTYLSLRINTTVIMASGSEYVKIFTINKKTGEIVSLKSLFSQNEKALDAISENIKNQMEEQMKADDSVSYFLHSEDSPQDDFKGITGDESFYFNSNGEIVIVFDEYEVAPGYMGAVEFTIPESVTGY